MADNDRFVSEEPVTTHLLELIAEFTQDLVRRGIMPWKEAEERLEEMTGRYRRDQKGKLTQEEIDKVVANAYEVASLGRCG